VLEETEANAAVPVWQTNPARPVILKRP